MPTANIRARRAEAVERFPRTERHIEMPPQDRMIQRGETATRRKAKQALAEILRNPELLRMHD